MSRKLSMFCACAAFLSGLTYAQVSPSDPIAYPTQSMSPIILPWDKGGVDYGKPGENGPFPPHRIIANIYYVGSAGTSVWLITSDEGHILIDSLEDKDLPMVKKNIETMGFRFEDIKILLMDHAHIDHMAASATIKKMTGAKLMVMDADVEVTETGGAPEPNGPMPPAHVDRVLHDRDVVSLGGNVLTAYKTPGHTPGATTWMMTVQEGGKSYVVNIQASISINETRWLVSPNVLDLVEQYRQAFRVMRSLPCDIWLSAHQYTFHPHQKYAKLQKGGGPNPYIDPEGYKAFLDLAESNFYYRLDWANRWLGSAPGQFQRGAIPIHELPPVIVPWELGGPEFALHTKEQDSAAFPAHGMIGNVWYVGQADNASYLITTAQGHILINTGYESAVPLLQKSVEDLKFRLQDIKVILLTRASRAQAEGAALVKKLTGAQLVVMDRDAEAVERGDVGPEVKVDRRLHDQEQVTMGNTTITAHRTPASTPGNTTLVWKSMEAGNAYTVVLPGDLSSDARALTDPSNPYLVEDYRHTFALLKTLPCDIFLGTNAKYFNLREKYPVAGRGKGPGSNPYIDPDGYSAHVKLMERSFYYKLDAAHRQPKP
jgi:metallo-beta-lactamase class B